MTFDKTQVLDWLREEDTARLEELWRMADTVRRDTVGDEVHLRGLIEISNFCTRACGYCGLRSGNTGITRYRMREDEVLACARLAREYGFGTVVMQAGEDYGITREWLAGVVRRIKEENGLAVTLSMGERPDEDLAAWREAGADRYLLRFETSDAALYERIHPTPPDRPHRNRIAILGVLKELGYETGSGVMVGIPGQTYGSLAADIDLYRQLDLDMVGEGPYIANPDTPLGAPGALPPAPKGEQVPDTDVMTYKVLALTRLVCPEANIPSTTALATVNREHGRELGLQRGANVVMPNLTPPGYRCHYEIYPKKATIEVTSPEFRERLRDTIEGLGRTIGAGPGGRMAQYRTRA